jgi:putative FmdB family regulatory protein
VPIYELECTKCGHVFEVMQKIADPLPPCPECQAETQKLMSSVAVVQPANAPGRRVGKKAAAAAERRDPYAGTAYDTSKKK